MPEVFPRPALPPVKPLEPPRLPPEEEPPFLATAVFVDLLADAKPLEEEPRLLRLADDPPFDALRPPPDDFFVADFLDAPFLLPPFFAAAFFEPPRDDPPREDLLPPLDDLEDFFEAPFFTAPLLAALFLDAPFFEEPPLPEEPPRRDDFLDAPFLLAPFFEDLPPREDLLPPFLAAFLVDFAIVNGFCLRLKRILFFEITMM